MTARNTDESSAPRETTQIKLAFAVFAHNEAANIIRCLKSIEDQCRCEIHVLINGCTDHTADIVKEYAEEHRHVHPHVIHIGDKANAWNFYVHDIGVEAELHYFLDGDCWIVPGAVDEIRNRFGTLVETTKDLPNAFSGTPLPTTRKRRKWVDTLKREGGLQGNFYALTGDFIDRIRQDDIRLPIGIIGEDGLVGALACWDLSPATGWNKERIAVLENANFDYRPLSALRPDDLKLYFRRKIRYSMRYLQNQMIKEAFHNERTRWLRGHAVELYSIYPHHLELKWRGRETFFDWLAIRRMRHELATATGRRPD